MENVYDYMHAADAFVTKPGGLSVAEALVAAIPMVLCKPLPGQEERNARFLIERGAAVRRADARRSAGERWQACWAIRSGAKTHDRGGGERGRPMRRATPPSRSLSLARTRRKYVA